MSTPLPERSDICQDHWLLRLAPAPAKPYLRLARLDRPIGTWLLLWPCWWSLALAADNWPDPLLLLLFAVGAVVMRGAGCCWNDIADRDIDGNVARTAGRPIPSGEVSVLAAAIFMVLLGLIGLAILSSFNRFAILIGIASLATVVVYPYMKRITWWPQFFLGLAFNWGALLGWAAVRGELGWPPLLLYLGGIFWTLGYDTIYAHQDKEDDALIGVRSTALRLGDASKPWLTLFFGLALTLFAVSASLAGLPPPYLLAIALAAIQCSWQIGTLDLNDPDDCLAKFNSNTLFGWILFLGFIFANGLG